MLLGFMLSAYSIVANDAIQTLGTFLSSNSQRPWWVLWLFACTILTAVFAYGWLNYDGDVSYGRLENFPIPDPFSWIYIVPPLILLGLTNLGIPVSTTFLILTVFNPQNLTNMLTKSLIGYGLAFIIGIFIYYFISEKIEEESFNQSKTENQPYWTILQWVSTTFLWSQWLIQDLANIFAYLPRKLDLLLLFFSLIIMLTLHAIIFYRNGGEIQQIVTSKINTQNIKSATIIDFIYGFILLFFKEYSKVPMSTTWVFIGLLAGRELAIAHRLKHRSLKDTGTIIIKDVGKAMIGLGVSIILAFFLPFLGQLIS
ncbi:membrane protein [Aphanothece sacrum FPU1]|uniref:Membrane protein n=2 Tax=Aphanothece sacrum TaxID=1122 RepID=A0A401ICJ7_APHSA|nr:membrane protein [Aphanothece sacrum FPU1]GBF86114.1 membrane protein [Aphanothece sacrum FPU3]